MSGFLRCRAVASVLFAVTGFAFALGSLFTKPLTAAAVGLPNGDYLTVSWLVMGALICFLYAILYYSGGKLLKLNAPISLSLLHLLITVLAVVGFENQHYFGLGYVPLEQISTAQNGLITFLARHAAALLLVGSFFFVTIMFVAWLLKRFRPCC